MAHKQLNTFHLFAGAGGGILADLLLGHNPIGACEIEPYPRDVLLARQRDGLLPEFPIWDDVATLDGHPWRGSVDVLCGGFPCQDISAAGKGAGISGERSGLWKEYARLIGEMRPRFVFAENSPLLRTRGLGVVLEDLAALGYNARWGVLGARDVGAPHKRDRMWVLAYSTSERLEATRPQQQTTGTTRKGEDDELAYTNNNGDIAAKESRSTSQGSDSSQTRQEQTSKPSGLCASRANGSMEGTPEDLAYAMHQGLQRDQCTRRTNPQGRKESDGSTTKCGGLWWHTDPAEGDFEPLVGRVADGVANRVDRLKAIGNGQTPQCAALAFSILSEGLI
jgi:DNA (cytosine-5)-methyltransferase 1